MFIPVSFLEIYCETQIQFCNPPFIIPGQAAMNIYKVILGRFYIKVFTLIKILSDSKCPPQRRQASLIRMTSWHCLANIRNFSKKK